MRSCASATSAEQFAALDRDLGRAADRPDADRARRRGAGSSRRRCASTRPSCARGAPLRDFCHRLVEPETGAMPPRPDQRQADVRRRGPFPGYRGTGADITAEVEATRSAARAEARLRDAHRQHQRRLRAVRRARPAGDLQPPLRRDRRGDRGAAAPGEPAGRRSCARASRPVTTPRPEAARRPISPSASSITAAPTAASSSSSSATTAGSRSASTAPRTAARSARAPTSPSSSAARAPGSSSARSCAPSICASTPRSTT